MDHHFGPFATCDGGRPIRYESARGSFPSLPGRAERRAPAESGSAAVGAHRRSAAASVALLAPQLATRAARRAALAGAAIAAALVPVAPAGIPVLAALVVVQTATDGPRLALDARLPAVAIAAVAVWRRAPFAVTVVLAAATSGALHALA
jgi:hypothetical protein